jgi:hypothetical protein
MQHAGVSTALASASVVLAPTMAANTWPYWLAIACLGGGCGAMAPYWQREYLSATRYAMATITGMLMSLGAAAGSLSIWGQEGIGVLSAVVAGFFAPRLVADPEFISRMVAVLIKAWRGK